MNNGTAIIVNYSNDDKVYYLVSLNIDYLAGYNLTAMTYIADKRHFIKHIETYNYMLLTFNGVTYYLPNIKLYKWNITEKSDNQNFSWNDLSYGYQVNIEFTFKYMTKKLPEGLSKTTIACMTGEDVTRTSIKRREKRININKYIIRS